MKFLMKLVITCGEIEITHNYGQLGPNCPECVFSWVWDVMSCYYYLAVHHNHAKDTQTLENLFNFYFIFFEDDLIFSSQWKVTGTRSQQASGHSI